MLIIAKEPILTGYHSLEYQPWRTEVWMEGYIEVPAHLREKVMACAGYCDLQIEDGVLVGIIPKELPPAPPPDPDPMQQLRADVEYISMMTGVEL